MKAGCWEFYRPRLKQIPSSMPRFLSQVRAIIDPRQGGRWTCCGTRGTRMDHRPQQLSSAYTAGEISIAWATCLTRRASCQNVKIVKNHQQMLKENEYIELFRCDGHHILVHDNSHGGARTPSIRQEKCSPYDTTTALVRPMLVDA